MWATGITGGNSERRIPRTRRGRGEIYDDDALGSSGDAAAASVGCGKIAGVWPADYDIADRQLRLAEVEKRNTFCLWLAHNFVPQVESLRQNRSDRDPGPVQQEGFASGHNVGIAVSIHIDCGKVVPFNVGIC